MNLPNAVATAGRISVSDMPAASGMLAMWYAILSLCHFSRSFFTAALVAIAEAAAVSRANAASMARIALEMLAFIAAFSRTAFAFASALLQASAAARSFVFRGRR